MGAVEDRIKLTLANNSFIIETIVVFIHVNNEHFSPSRPFIRNTSVIFSAPQPLSLLRWGFLF